MRVRVRMRVDPATGEVDLIVEDQSAGPLARDHDEHHDLLAAEVGRVIEPGADIVEIAQSGARANPGPVDQAEDSRGQEEESRRQGIHE